MGQLHVFNSVDNSHETIKANGKIKDVFAGDNYVVIKEGHRLNGDYEIKENDVLFVRYIPHGTETIAIISIVSAVLALGVGVGSAIYAKQKSAELQEEYEKQQQAANELAQKITALPFLQGAKNRTALGQTIPYFMGSMYFAPYLLNSGFYSVGGTDGKEQYWNAILCCGYKNQKLESLSIGNTKLITFNQSEEQVGQYTVHSDTYGDVEIELCNSGELYSNGLSQKVIGEIYGDEIKHDFGKSAEPLVKQLPENVQRVEVCIKFDGLRQYSDGWKTRDVIIHPFWSNNADSANPTWHPFHFHVSAPTYQWRVLDQTGINQAIAEGLISTSTTTIVNESRQPETHTIYISNSSNITVKCINLKTDSWEIQRQYVISTENDRFSKNTNETIRYTASYDFSASESFGKNISIKLERENAKLEDGSGQETAILQYINTFCYDAYKSSNTQLVPCRPMENPQRDQTLRIGVKIRATANTVNILDEINIITCGTGRIFNGSILSDYKSPTRNPAAVILELLTSDFHQPSKYEDIEIRTQSFYTAYNYCAQNGLYCDSVITAGISKRDLIKKILQTIGASLIIGSDGLLEIAIDKKENSPVALLNSQSIKSVRYAKSFERKITGLKTTYTDRNTWAIATNYFMRDGTQSYDQYSDRLGELALDTVTTFEHAYKVAQRQQRESILQPRTLEIEVGLEGELYPLYSVVLVQLEQFKQGIGSSLIKEIHETDGIITSIVIQDSIEFVDNNRYGVIIQAQNSSGKRQIEAEIIGSGTTSYLVFKEGVPVGTIAPEIGNELSIGLLTDSGNFERVTNKMKIYGIKPADNHGWLLEVKDYNEELYEFGDIPAYKSNLTTRPTTAIPLSTVTPDDVNAARVEAQAYAKEIGNGLSARIDNIVTTATVCSADVTQAVYDIGDDNKTYEEKTTEITISLRQGEIELPFFIGEIPNLPNGFTYTVEGKKLLLTVGAGVELKSGMLSIPVEYRPIVSATPYVDQNGRKYVDESGRLYYDIKYASTGTIWTLYFTYFGSGNPVYLGMRSSLDDLPENPNMGDYFVWSGNNHTITNLCADGEFLQARTYKFVGTSRTWQWERDTDSGHAQIVLSDVLGIANADLKNNNSTVWEYLDHLTSNSVYTDMLVANQAFIAQIAAQVITAEIVSTDQLNAAIADLQNAFVSGTLTVGKASTADSAGTASDSSKVQGITIIEGGKIKADLIDVAKIKATSGFFNNISVSGYGIFNKGLSANFINEKNIKLSALETILRNNEILYRTRGNYYCQGVIRIRGSKLFEKDMYLCLVGMYSDYISTSQVTTAPFIAFNFIEGGQFSLAVVPTVNKKVGLKCGSLCFNTGTINPGWFESNEIKTRNDLDADSFLSADTLVDFYMLI